LKYISKRHVLLTGDT